MLRTGLGELGHTCMRPCALAGMRSCGIRAGVGRCTCTTCLHSWVHEEAHFDATITLTLSQQPRTAQKIHTWATGRACLLALVLEHHEVPRLALATHEVHHLHA